MRKLTVATHAVVFALDAKPASAAIATATVCRSALASTSRQRCHRYPSQCHHCCRD